MTEAILTDVAVLIDGVPLQGVKSLTLTSKTEPDPDLGGYRFIAAPVLRTITGHIELTNAGQAWIAGLHHQATLAAAAADARRERLAAFAASNPAGRLNEMRNRHRTEARRLDATYNLNLTFT